MGGHVTGDPQVYEMDRILFEIAFLFLIYTRRIIFNYSKSPQTNPLSSSYSNIFAERSRDYKLIPWQSYYKKKRKK